MNSRISSYFFFVLLLGAVIAAAVIFLPFLTPLILALAGSVVAYPIYRFFIRMFGKSGFGRTISALFTVVIILVVILVPLFFLVSSIYSEIQTLYGMLTDEGSRSQVVASLNSISQTLSNMVFGVVQPYSFDSFNVTEYLKNGLQLVFANLDNIFTSLTKVGGYALVFLLALFYFLRDGKILKQRFISWSPLLDKNDEYITVTLKRAIRSVFVGSISVSVIDGILIGIGFLIMGIPAPALWGTVAAVAALVPGFGVSLVVIPAAGYLVITGHYLMAVIMLIYGYATIILIDHTLGPNLINRGIHIHPFLVLLSVLGGLVTFGIVGFLMGPMILVMLFTLLELYKTTFMDPKIPEHKEGEQSPETNIVVNINK